MSIAVWNTGFLGDAVLTLPLLQALHRACPDDALCFIVRKGLKPLFEHHPALAEVLEFDKRGAQKSLHGMMRFGRTLADRKIAIWISAHTSLRSAIMARLSHAPMRIGYAPEAFFPGGYAWAYTETVKRRFGQVDEIERLLGLLEPLGIVNQGDAWPEIVVADAARHEARERWASFGGRPVLGMHPGSVWPTKRWPLEYFARIGALAVRGGCHVLLFGGPGEETGMCARLEHAIRITLPEEAHGFVHNAGGTLTLPQLAAEIALLDAYLTNDSGPMHLAWTQRVPTVAMFGPTTPHLGFAPRGPEATVLEMALPCRPCGRHGHRACPKNHFRCMRDLKPEQAWEHLAPYLAEKHIPRHTAS